MIIILSTTYNLGGVKFLRLNIKLIKTNASLVMRYLGNFLHDLHREGHHFQDSWLNSHLPQHSGGSLDLQF